MIGILAILPILAAIPLWLIRERPARFHWAVSVGFSAVPLIGFSLSAILIPTDFSFSTWQPAELFRAVLLLRLDEVSWPLVVAVSSLPLIIFLCGPARAEAANPANRSIIMAYVGFALIGVLAANPTTAILAWVSADLLGFLALLGTADSERTVRGSFRRFLAHLTSTLFLMVGAVSSETSFSILVTQVSWVLAVALRLGLWPLHVAMPAMPGVRRGLGVVFRLVPPLMGMAFLARFSADQMPAGLAGWLVALAALSIILGGIRWAISSDPINARPFFVLIIAGMSIAALAGAPTSRMMIVGLAMMMTLIGVFISQFEIYEQWQRYLVGLASAFALGLPWTISHTAHGSLEIGNLTSALEIITGVAIPLGFAAVALGIGRSAQAAFSEWGSGEVFVRNAYSIGLLIPLVLMVGTGLQLGIRPTSGSLVSLALALGLAGLGWYAVGRWRSQTRDFIQFSAQTLNERVENSLSAAVRLLLSVFSSWLRWLGRFFEGKAGLLWIYVVLLIVALLLTRPGS